MPQKYLFVISYYDPAIVACAICVALGARVVAGVIAENFNDAAVALGDPAEQRLVYQTPATWSDVIGTIVFKE